MDKKSTLLISFFILLAGIAVYARTGVQYLPLAFEESKGQAGEGMRFLTKTPAYHLMFKRLEIEITSPSRSVLVRFGGASAKAKPEGRGRLDELIRYVNADPAQKDRKKVPAFALVRYSSLYPGIDLTFWGRGSEVQYEFAVDPESDPGQIRFLLDNAGHLEVAEDGGLIIGTGENQLHLKKPAAFQHDVEGRRPVDIRYKLSGVNEVQFELSDYDPALPLTIR